MKKYIGLVSLVLLLSGCGGPSDKEVKNIAYQYMDTMIDNIHESEIRINNSYNSNGKTIMVLEIRNMICEMPMLESSKGWVATGIRCN